MPVIKRKVPQTLDFVEGLLISADEIPRALSGELEPRQVLAQKHTSIAKLSPKQIQDLGKYQGRVVLVALAAELALKFAWETENQKEAACGGHDLQKCFGRLSEDIKDQIRQDYRSRIKDPPEEWKTVDQVFEICRKAFVEWRYIVEENSYPNYIMRATYLRDATQSVVAVIYARYDKPSHKRITTE